MPGCRARLALRALPASRALPGQPGSLGSLSPGRPADPALGTASGDTGPPVLTGVAGRVCPAGAVRSVLAVGTAPPHPAPDLRSRWSAPGSHPDLRRIYNVVPTM